MALHFLIQINRFEMRSEILIMIIVNLFSIYGCFSKRTSDKSAVVKTHSNLNLDTLNTRSKKLHNKIIIDKFDGFGYIDIYLIEADSLITSKIDSVRIYDIANYKGFKNLKLNNDKIQNTLLCEVHRRVGSGISLDEYIYIFNVGNKIYTQFIPKKYSHDVMDTYPIERNNWIFEWKYDENMLYIKSEQKDRRIKYDFEIPLYFSNETFKYEIDFIKAKEVLRKNDFSFLLNDSIVYDYFEKIQ